MDATGTYRHELKCTIDESTYQALRRQLRCIMQPDSHVGATGTYTIRSIYFENYRDEALREKLDGVQFREKFRIRWYQDDRSYITLEKKCKYNDLCQKLDASLTQDEFARILRGDCSWMLTHPSPLVRELYCKMHTLQLRPRVLVSYIREPYVYAPGNVRVTFDSGIRTSLFTPKLDAANIPDICATDLPGARILEIKYDAFLPQILSDVLRGHDLRLQAFSKYGICRRFG